MNAVIYCRVSSKKQELEGHGAESQEYSCRQYAELKGWKVLKVFTDKAYSGALEDRPQANEMLVYLLDHPNTVVLMDDISRQARDREIYYNLKTKIQKLGCQPKFVNLEIPDNEDGEFFELVSVGLAEWMRKKNRAQVLKRMQARLGSGYWCFYPPRGYQFGDDKTLILKEPEATALKEVLESFANGYIQNQSESIKILNDKGFKTSRTKVKDILIDPIYAGRIDYPKWSIFVEKAKHPALISYETHLKILERLNEKPAKTISPDKDTNFLLKGIVKCSECQKNMQAFISNKKTRSGERKYYARYDCRTKNCKFAYNSVRQDVMEAGIENEIKKLQPKKSLIQIFEITLEQVIKDYANQAESIKTDIKKSVAKKELEIERVVKRIAKTDRDSIVEALEDELEKLYKEKTVLETKFKMVADDNSNLRTPLNEICKYLENLDKHWLNSPTSDKRMLIDILFDNQIVYDQNSNLRTLKKSYLMRLFDRVVQKSSIGGQEGSEFAPQNIFYQIRKYSTKISKFKISTPVSS